MQRAKRAFVVLLVVRSAPFTKNSERSEPEEDTYDETLRQHINENCSALFFFFSKGGKPPKKLSGRMGGKLDGNRDPYY
jgi:hypothetical protein